MIIPFAPRGRNNNGWLEHRCRVCDYWFKVWDESDMICSNCVDEELDDA